MFEYSDNGKSKGKEKYGDLLASVSSIENVSDPICQNKTIFRTIEHLTDSKI